MSINKDDYLKSNDNYQSISNTINNDIKLTIQCLLTDMEKMLLQRQKITASHVMTPRTFLGFPCGR